MDTKEYTPEIVLKAAMAVVSGRDPEDVAAQYGVEPALVSQWAAALLERSAGALAPNRRSAVGGKKADREKQSALAASGRDIAKLREALRGIERDADNGGKG